MTTIIREPFPPGRSAPCFCGSGNRFKSCCGLTSAGLTAGGMNRQAPAGIGIVQNFLNSERCQQICNFANTQNAKWLEVIDIERSTANQIAHKRDDRRVTERVNVSGHQDSLDDLVRLALQENVVPEYAREFDWFEQAQLLKYTPGGRYEGHADSDNYDIHDGLWKKVLDRDVSLLMYLNDEYEGGTLHFEYFNYTIQPQAGMLVYFPSDIRYRHEARPVTAGLRYALVSWAAFTDEPRVQTVRPKNLVYLKPQG